MDALLADLRYGLRLLRKSPVFALVTIGTLALGIGANAAIYSVVDSVVLRPLPYDDADRIVMVWEDASHVSFPRNTPAPANYFSWKDLNRRRPRRRDQCSSAGLVHRNIVIPSTAAHPGLLAITPQYLGLREVSAIGADVYAYVARRTPSICRRTR